MVGWGSKLQEWCFSTPFECCVFQTRKLKHIWNKKTWKKDKKGTAISDHTLYQHFSHTVLYFCWKIRVARLVWQKNPAKVTPTARIRARYQSCSFPTRCVTPPHSQVTHVWGSFQASTGWTWKHGEVAWSKLIKHKTDESKLQLKKKIQIRNAYPFLQHLWGWDFQTWICRWCFMGVSKPKMQVLDPKKSSWMIAWSNEKPHQTKRVKNSTEHLAAKISKEWNCSTSWI